MSISKKKPGAEPLYAERWKELAKDGARLAEAASVYLEETNSKSLTEAFREVREFNRNFMATFRRPMYKVEVYKFNPTNNKEG